MRSLSHLVQRYTLLFDFQDHPHLTALVKQRREKHLGSQKFEKLAGGFLQKKCKKISKRIAICRQKFILSLPLLNTIVSTKNKS